MVGIGLAKEPALTTPPWKTRQEFRALRQEFDVREHVSVHDQNVGEFAFLQRTELVPASHDLRAGLRGTSDHFERGEADIS